MPVRIIVDEAVAAQERPRIEDVVRSALIGQQDPDSLIAVVTKLPSGRLTVFVNHLEDAASIVAIEAALARLR